MQIALDAELYELVDPLFGFSTTFALENPQLVNVLKLQNETECAERMRLYGIYYWFIGSKDPIEPHEQQLIPKLSIRQRAEQSLQRRYNSTHRTIISVHRRWMEGGCMKRAQRTFSANSPPNCTLPFRYQMCKITRDEIPFEDSDNTTVLLFTDEQAPAMDKTFTNHAPHDLFTQYWMMVLTDANPQSTVDWVVHYWRTAYYNRGTNGTDPRMRPKECFTGRHSFH